MSKKAIYFLIILSLFKIFREQFLLEIALRASMKQICILWEQAKSIKKVNIQVWQNHFHFSVLCVVFFFLIF